ncbi:MAG: polyhydroxyalkanoate depolymerase [Holosporaceae bacterium]|jgi:poly(3-hydroxybutyrate) depolymerase|nr:polyhydroxyalkanoate depolymerase [Holosporaceae bacterium]
MYDTHDAWSYLLAPSRKLASSFRSAFNANPAGMDYGVSRLCEGLADMYERSTRDVKKPEFNIDYVDVNGEKVKVFQTTVLKKPFGDLVRFSKENQGNEPKVLIIAPISGHFATLQRDTVRRMVPRHEVYITDWKSVRDVPLAAGSFDLDAYLSYLVDFIHCIGPSSHVMAICQPAVQLMALAAVLDEANDPCMPATIIPMGGPIDPRAKKTQVNELAESHPLNWFEKNFITVVPHGHIGAGRRVYPGFVQLTAFINMNPDAHYKAHVQYLEDKILNNKGGMDRHSTFYDEYLSVLDMDDVYYLQTIEKIFQTYELPRGVMKYKGNTIDLSAIRNCALLTIEGEKDDISAPGQTFAAHGLCPNIPTDMRAHHLQPGVGHYGVFSGSKWRSQIAGKVEEFIAKFDHNVGTYKRAAKSPMGHKFGK